MTTPIFTKDPAGVLDYTFDWADWLAVGDTIQTSTWSVPTGITQVTTALAGAKASIWLSGGTAGTTYRVTNHIVTTGGRTDERSFTIIMLNK